MPAAAGLRKSMVGHRPPPPPPLQQLLPLAFDPSPPPPISLTCPPPSPSHIYIHVLISIPHFLTHLPCHCAIPPPYIILSPFPSFPPPSLSLAIAITASLLPAVAHVHDKQPPPIIRVTGRAPSLAFTYDIALLSSVHRTSFLALGSSLHPRPGHAKKKIAS